MADRMQILVRENGESIETAALINDRLSEFDRREKQLGSLVGCIMLGKVERVLPDIKAAFVDIGRGLNGFLPIRESDSFHAVHGKAPLITGNDVIVQVKKDEKGGKGAFLTRDVSLAGQYLLLLPNSRFIGVSKRITDHQENQNARLLGKSIAGDRFGVIVRHAALYARREDVMNEAEELYQRWLKATEHASCQKPPVCLLRDVPAHEALMRDYSARYQVNMLLEETIAKASPPSEPAQAISSIEMDALWKGKGIERCLKQALARKVVLPRGGSLIIDEREALHTIDVNSGRNVNASEEAQLPLEQNLAAVPEIAHQIRLRNLSGIILIDFIDMNTCQEQEQVIGALSEALSHDRIKSVIHGFTTLGLLELTRRRSGAMLKEMITVPCHTCSETGRIYQP
ncbi:MAG: hypothetical protein E7319_02970 [Clostridiales bacterium]|nr:hypothetical protein [Clostridiales bacterium]